MRRLEPAGDADRQAFVGNELLDGEIFYSPRVLPRPNGPLSGGKSLSLVPASRLRFALSALLYSQGGDDTAGPVPPIYQRPDRYGGCERRKTKAPR
jgi:hypothetical protein